MDTSLRRRLGISAACVMLSFIIAWIDYITGNASDAFVLFYIPVGIATWIAGIGPGIVLAFISGLAWITADVLSPPLPSLLVEFWDTVMRLGSFLLLVGATARIRSDIIAQRRLNADLTRAMAEIKQLTGILPMCSFCRKIRDEKEEWVPLEAYIRDHSDAQVSHGLCPRCYRKHYAQVDGT